jgi:hypothetical protein
MVMALIPVWLESKMKWVIRINTSRIRVRGDRYLGRRKLSKLASETL